MRTIAIALLGLALVHGRAAAQTPAEQAQIVCGFQQSVADYAQRRGLDHLFEGVGTATPPPRIFTLPVATVFRQLIAAAIASAPATAAMRGFGASHHPAVFEWLPTTELIDFPPVLAAALPPLPRGIEYRLAGNDLVLRDANADLIIAVLRDAVGNGTTTKR